MGYAERKDSFVETKGCMVRSKAPLHAVSGEAAASDLAAARRVLTTASQALTGLAEALDGDFSHAVGMILAAKGRVIVSGMGKSGHVARKIAATFSSTGTPAYFVHPAEASHGDMGAITRQDELLLLSWGGETAELSDLITYAKRHRIPIVAIGANPASTTMMLSLGDALAVALMERKGFSADQYRDFHPGGSLGRALIRVSDLMHTGSEIPLVTERDSMQHVLVAMAERRFGCVGVTDKKGALIGIITDGDLRRHM